MPFTHSIFIDTSAFLALVNSQDNYHQIAKSFIEHWKEQLPQYTNLTTNDYVISETLTKIRFKIGSKEAVTFGDVIFKSQLVDITYLGDEGFKKAWEIFRFIESKNINDDFTYLEDDSIPITNPTHHPTISFTDATIFASIIIKKVPALFALDPDLHYLAQSQSYIDIGQTKDKTIKVFPQQLHK